MRLGGLEQSPLTALLAPCFLRRLDAHRQRGHGRRRDTERGAARGIAAGSRPRQPDSRQGGILTQEGLQTEPPSGNFVTVASVRLGPNDAGIVIDGTTRRAAITPAESHHDPAHRQSQLTNQPVTNRAADPRDYPAACYSWPAACLATDSIAATMSLPLRVVDPAPMTTTL